MEALEQAEEFLGPVGVARRGLGVLQFVVGVPRWRLYLGDAKKRVKQIKLEKRETSAEKGNELSNCNVGLGLGNLEGLSDVNLALGTWT